MTINPLNDSKIQKAVNVAASEGYLHGHLVARNTSFPFLKPLINFVLKFFDDHFGKHKEQAISNLKFRTLTFFAELPANQRSGITARINQLCLEKFDILEKNFGFKEIDAKAVEEITESMKGFSEGLIRTNLVLELDRLDSIEKLSARDIAGEDDPKNASKDPNPTKITYVKAYLTLLKNKRGPLIPLKSGSEFTDNTLNTLFPENKEIIKKLAAFCEKHKQSVSSELLGDVFGPLCFPDSNKKNAAADFQYIIDNYKKLFP